MAFKEKEKGDIRLNISSMIDVTFLLLIYFIVSMQMEPSLDNIIKLPPIKKASKQEDALLQIYVLPAKIEEGGRIHPDSTGLIAFSDKAKMPEHHPKIPEIRYLDQNGAYIPGSLLDSDGKPIMDFKNEMAKAYGDDARPPSFICAKTGVEIGPYLALDDIPGVIGEKKREVLDLMVKQRNGRYARNNLPLMTQVSVDSLEKEIYLNIKADQNAFYGRILQVVNMSKDTASDIKNFAFVTLTEASEEVLEAQKEQGK